MHLEIEITRLATARGRLPLSGETDELAFGNSRGNVDAHRARAQLDGAVALYLRVLELEGARRAREGFFETHVEPRMMIAPAARSARPGAAKGRAAAEERGEEFAEILRCEVALLAAVPATSAIRAPAATARPAWTTGELESAAPVGRGPKLLARFPLASELIVCRALLCIAQHLVRLLHFLEVLFGVRLLADVGVVLAGKPAIRRLDLIGGRGTLDAQYLVVVAKLHHRPAATGSAHNLTGGAILAVGWGRSVAQKSAPRGGGIRVAAREERTRGICSQLHRGRSKACAKLKVLEEEWLTRWGTFTR